MKHQKISGQSATQPCLNGGASSSTPAKGRGGGEGCLVADKLRAEGVAPTLHTLQIGKYSCLALLILLLSACQLTAPPTQQITVQVDGGERVVQTQAETVRGVLRQAEIRLNELDRVQPDLYTPLTEISRITVTRVTEELFIREEVIPFEQQTVTNESLAPNESRLAQLGVNGVEEVSVRAIYEDNLLVSQTEIARTVITATVPEILVIGPQQALAPVRFAGTITYLANNTAWLLRGDSGNRRPIVTGVTFDDHVFTLSPDGQALLYTEAVTGQLETDSPTSGLELQNELRLASTIVVGEEPTSLGVSNVLQASWSPDGSVVVYSTAEPSSSPPGWRARNDLWRINPTQRSPRPTLILPEDRSGLYAWWGVDYVWSPNGEKLAYARPDEVGVITFTTQQPFSYTKNTLANFAPYETLSDWVWVPQLSWSADSRFIATPIHGALHDVAAGRHDAIDNQFDLWLLDSATSTKINLAEQVGMWANPVWGAQGIAYGQSLDPTQSVNSRYTIQHVDSDGSNRQQRFPVRSEPGVYSPQMYWSADGRDLLFLYNGNLYLANTSSSTVRQLTLDGQVRRMAWATVR